MQITRKEKAGFGKDVNKTLELISKLSPEIKDAALKYLQGNADSNPVMKDLIESAVEIVNNTPSASPENGVIAISSTNTDNDLTNKLEFGKATFGEAIESLTKAANISQLENMVAGNSKYAGTNDESVSETAAVVGSHISKLLRIAGF